MNVQLKVGSVIRIPVMAGMNVSSSAPTNATAVLQGQMAVITAVKVGTAAITVQLASDLAVTLTVNVVAA